ncbi:glycoside hydrolase family 32 protein [Tessaracoccus sp. MC1865]|uniref:glycoside hydrolase family 32 protein n=1 Tax=Tessaracoccus sp. MC1865 TaxID=2760310 RepID=UPI00160483F8|nr:glycoside hydrolase family 32 protein [Tessaracoccus sp. MC1865]MBB1482464.1 glycoside hydrolase family 32 protein [Tessaracoccus sp. MC1865]QTO38080.1 glycoside hydrolase family 32 protein [Tessaracoccus sp. MC1865]
MRPSFHFTPASGWMNDPHGITARNGGYDTFFQYVPGQTVWGPNCHWGHASGPDLLTLREHQVAIAPGDGDDGIWTGTIVEAGESAHAFFTAVSTPDFGIGRIRVAHPSDGNWANWNKGRVVVQAPDELDLIAYRDPFIRPEGDGWRMFVGAAGRDGTAMALTYTSPDLSSWRYDGIALQRHTSEVEPVWMGSLWECPQVFDLDGRSFMVSSIWDADVLHYAAYASGTFADGRFEVHAWDRLTWGPSLYAPSLFTDADGRPGLTFWLRGVGGDGWQGAHSVPYRLSTSEGRLVALPHPDVAAHRTRLAEDGVVPALAADVEWAGEAGTLTISSGGREVASLSRSAHEATATTPSSSDTFPVRGPLRIIVDGPVLEVSSEAGVFAIAVEPQGAELRVSASGGVPDVYALG